MFRATFRLSTALAVGSLVVGALPAGAGEAVPETTVARSTPDPVVSQPHGLTVLRDDFANGAMAGAVKWSTVAGIWRGRNGALVTSVPIPLRLAPRANPAAIMSRAPIDNAFRIEIVLAGRGVAPATIDVGPYLGNDADSGYRLIYDGEYERPLKLVSSIRGRIATLAAAAPEADLYNGDPHAIVWTRDVSGRMTVAIDGHPALEATDRSIASRFGGFSMVNAGGSWEIGSVAVRNPSEILGY